MVCGNVRYSSIYIGVVVSIIVSPCGRTECRVRYKGDYFYVLMSRGSDCESSLIYSDIYMEVNRVTSA